MKIDARLGIVILVSMTIIVAALTLIYMDGQGKQYEQFSMNILSTAISGENLSYSIGFNNLGSPIDAHLTTRVEKIAIADRMEKISEETYNETIIETINPPVDVVKLTNITSVDAAWTYRITVHCYLPEISSNYEDYFYIFAEE